MDRFSMDKLKNAVDEAKSAVKARMGTDTEKKIEEALSNKNWGASSTLLNELSQLTFDYEGYSIIMKRIWEALDSEARQWRTIFKALTLVEHLVKNGTERVVESTRDHMFKIRTLTSFSYNDGTADKGTGVRDKAKQLLDLLNDNDRIREEREKARRLRDKYVGIGSNRGTFGGFSGGSTSGGGSYSGGGYNAGSSYSGSGYSDRYDGGDGYGQKSSDRYSDRDSSSGSRRGSTDRDRRSSGGSDRDRSSRSKDRYDEESEESEEETVRATKKSSKRRAHKKKSQAEANKEEETASSGTPSAAPSLLDQDFFAAESASPAAAPTNVFDPFSAPAQPQPAATTSMPAAPVPQQSMNMFNAFSSPQQAQAQMNPFSPPAAAANQFAPPPMPQQQQYAQQMNYNQPPQTGQYGSNSSGFGDFQSAAPPQQQQQQQQQQPAKPVQPAARPNRPVTTNPNDAWGAGSKLFDLSSLKSNSSAAASSTGNGFSDLDAMAGMSRPGAPSGMMQPPMSGGMRPMGGGMQPPMGMQGMGGMNYNMGQQQPRGNMNMQGGMPPQQQFNSMGGGMNMGRGQMMGQPPMGMPQQQMNMRPQMGGMTNNMYGGNMGMQSSARKQF